MPSQSEFGEPEKPLDALLAAYVAGRTSPPLSALLASHLELRPDNRAFVAGLEAGAGKWIDTLEPVPLTGHADRLAAILASEPDAPPPARMPASSVGNDALFPQALRHLVGRDSASLKWSFRLPGFRECPVFKGGGTTASLVWVKPGRALPHHTHEEIEATLVLKGSFHDVTGDYRRGDIAVADASTDHSPRAGTEEDCICFIVREGSLRLTGPVGRVVQRLFGH